METFYRIHWSDTPEFNADNAWSGLWGAERSEDGSQTKCRTCDGRGEDEGAPCDDCDGEGWEDCVRGYSCCWDAEGLLAYFNRPGMEPSGEQVIVFEGRQTGNGFDGEPCAVPSKVIETVTWEEFTARYV
jgi:hypothetical protein